MGNDSGVVSCWGFKSSSPVIPAIVMTLICPQVVGINITKQVARITMATHRKFTYKLRAILYFYLRFSRLGIATHKPIDSFSFGSVERSEERRVGKESG